MATNKEQEQLNTLLGKGISLTINGKKQIIKEPTLAVLDKMSDIWLKFPTIEDNMPMKDAIDMAKIEVHKHARNMAKVVAIALLGEAQFTPIIGKIRLWLKERSIYRHCRPTDIRNMVEIITATNGLANFIVSMKLMCTARSTIPKNVIE